jgi:hypothetical protein
VLPPLIAVAYVQYALDSRWQGGAAAAQRAEGERRRAPAWLAARGLRPSALGRWNGIAYYVIVAVPIVRDALGLAWPGSATVQVLAWGLVATTVVSIVSRVVSLRTAPGSPV